MKQIIALCKNAFDRLEEGKYLIIETPNPMSLAIYTHAFYIDPSHQKPVHPLTLKYLVEKAGRRKYEISNVMESEYGLADLYEILSAPFDSLQEEINKKYSS